MFARNQVNKIGLKLFDKIWIQVMWQVQTCLSSACFWKIVLQKHNSTQNDD